MLEPRLPRPPFQTTTRMAITAAFGGWVPFFERHMAPFSGAIDTWAQVA